MAKHNIKSLKKELDTYIQNNFTIDKEQLDRFGIEEKDYMYSMDKRDILRMLRHFSKWKKEADGKHNVWHDAKEEPQKDRGILLVLANDNIVVLNASSLFHDVFYLCGFWTKISEHKKWAYIDDILKL